MRVALDTSGWFAFISGDDKFHEAAVEFYKNVSELVVIYPVLEELTAIVHHRMGKAFVLKYVLPLGQNSNSKLVYLKVEDDIEIWKDYKKTPDVIDYVDCSVAWLAKKLKLPVFSFDRHFEKLGVERVPKL